MALTAPTPNDPEAWIEHACLAIKSETSNRLGLRAWSRLRGERAERARLLGERIRRHSYEADAALERAGVALLRRGLDRGDEVPEDTAIAVHQRARTLLRIRRLTPAAAAAVLVAAAVAAIMVGGPLWFPAREDDPSTRQGTLAGNEPGPTSSVATSEPAVAEATPADTILTVDFDSERMGQGLGPDWIQTVGDVDAVVLAPFPTAVNRSARLESVDVTGAEACRLIPNTAVRTSSLAVDVLLSEANTIAVIIGRTAAGTPALHVSLGSSGSAFTLGTGDPLARGGGMPVGTWIRTEITALGERTRWRVQGDSSAADFEHTIDASVLADVEHVCLAVSTNSTAAAHFDNLTIATVKEG